MPSSTDICEIFIIGPSSTGKTTLCTALAKELALPPECWITETARHVMRTHGFTREDVGKLEMQSAIMHAQIGNEEKGRTFAKGMLTPSHGLLLSDRSAIDALVYAILTSSTDEEAEVRRKELVESAEFQRALKHYRRATFILLRPVLEWFVDDGVRSLDDPEQNLLAFRKILQELGVNFKEMGGETMSLSDRVEFVITNPGLTKTRL